ncbi:hypothetical protein BGW36DRAFT_292130 [Talaromyces proteolyticus]|uniref:Myb-like domain-containing protein n=1 Tax=Talaromyces proteolyticus TaxID=1131652 RepID=A0AAD4KTW0_9EURO|nr:uncharacterized protein BGW36DRAFT_292130 [Talaromyces proteolyticus]KAH8700782.1 hypothetical protein BGW36DRAFT_292130 [Talaromyces proteolyticus]
MQRFSPSQNSTSPSLSLNGQDCDLAEITQGFGNGGPLSFTPPLLDHAQSTQDLEYSEAGMTSYQFSPIQADNINLAHPSSQRPLPDTGSTNVSSTWSGSDDAVLMNARARNHGWNQIQKDHFPNKTANACRKRYERLVAKRRVPEWDQEKLEKLSAEYNRLREETWQALASAIGEKWQDVEKACFDRGLKLLTSPSRAHYRNHNQVQRNEVIKASVPPPQPRRDSVLPLKDILSAD